MEAPDVDLELVRSHLANTRIGDSGLHNLGAMHPTSQFELYLCGTDITDRGLQYLASMKSFRLLDVSKTQVTYEGLRQMGGMLRLETVVLDRTQNAVAQGWQLGALCSRVFVPD